MANFTIEVASRKKVKMRINLGGVAGSGKTTSALLLAKGLVGDWSKIVVIDTEHGSASLYSHLGAFKTVLLEAPYDPKRYVEAIKFCESQNDIECIITDSISHEWEGQGGCLEIHSRMGGKFETWARVTPLHDAFKAAIINCSKHIITTCRLKTDYEMTSKKDSSDGKGRIEKVGLKSITREGFDYEVTISFKINHDHVAEIDKDRTGIFGGVIPFIIGEKTGEMIKNWNEEGELVDWGKTYSNRVELIISHISRLTDGFRDKEGIRCILEDLGASSSKEILEEKNIQRIAHWENILMEIQKTFEERGLQND